MKNFVLIITISFLLFLLGFLGLSFLTGYGLLDYWKQKLQVIVELKDEMSESDFESLQITLEKSPYVNTSTLNIITKDEAATMMKDDFGDEFLTLDIENPLRNVFTFNVTPEYSETSKLEAIKQELLQNAAVADIFYEKNVQQGMVKNISNFLWMALALGLLFIFVMVFIIRLYTILHWNTNKNDILASGNREESLQIWKKVEFYRNIKNGFWAAATAIIGLMLYNFWFNQSFQDLTTFIDNRFVILLFSSLMIVSIASFTLTTFWLQREQIIDTY